MPGTESTHAAVQPLMALYMSETIDIIGNYLSPPDLFRCILVCRAWNTLFIPHLYGTLDDNLYSWPMFLDPPRKQQQTEKTAAPMMRKDPDWILGTFTKYGHLVRHLSSRRYLFSDAASVSQTCTRLTSLTSYRAYYPYPYVKEDHPIHWRPDQITTDVSHPSTEESRHSIGIQRLWRLIQQNSETLRELIIDHLPLGDGILDHLAFCPRLTRLEIDWSHVSLQVLLERLSELRHLTFNGLYPQATALLMTSPMSQLVTLHTTTGMTRRAFFSLLTNLPRLKELWTACTFEDFTFKESVPPTDIKITVSQLQRLRFTKSTAILDSQEHLMIKEILPWVPDLFQIGVTYLSPEISAAISKYCPRMKSILQLTMKRTIRRKRRLNTVDTTSLSLLFANLLDLKVFDGIQYEITAQCMLENPWRCQGLEVLRLQIVGVTRLSEEEEMDYKQGMLFRRINRTLSEAEIQAVEKYENVVRKQHRLIYGQLATLVNLRVLELGMEYRDIELRYNRPMVRRGAQLFLHYGDLFPDTLELSLASGLDQLSTLSKLEVFGFESVDHRIDEEELRWMGEKWPRLRIMRGLQETEELRMLMHDGEKWHRRVFMQRLRPDVKHETRFKIGR